MNIELTDPHFSEKARALEALGHVIDPELGVNIVDLGLVYNLIFGPENSLEVVMTLSTPHCPMGESIMNSTRNALETAFLDRQVEVNLTWEPAWDIAMVSENGRSQLGI